MKLYENSPKYYKAAFMKLQLFGPSGLLYYCFSFFTLSFYLDWNVKIC